MEFDAVFVGAGHNALAAAVHLASRGWSVGVFERNDAAGGAVRTAEVTLPGFRHDLYAMNLSLFAGSPFHAEHGEGLRAHGLAFAPAEHCFASPMRDGRWFGVSKDLATTLARIEKFSAADALTWQAMLERFGGDAPHIFALLGSPMTTARARCGRAGSAWRQKGASWLRRDCAASRLLAARVPRTELRVPRDTGDARRLGHAPRFFARHRRAARSSPTSKAWPTRAFGMVIGAGGADTMIKAMVARLAELGGQVHLNSEVAEIVRAGAAPPASVSLPAKRSAPKRAVIAGVTPPCTGRPPAPRWRVATARYDAGAQKFRFGPGTMMLHLAMSGPARLDSGRGTEALRLRPSRALTST